MKIKDAVENLNYMMSENCTENQWNYIEEIDMAISALEKQIPQKPIPVTEGSMWSKCPVCGDTYIDNYCGRCGQKLDWEDKDSEVDENNA